MYFDPGFGSIIIQLVVAGIAAAGTVWVVMKARVKGWFGKKSSQKTDDKKEAADDEL